MEEDLGRLEKEFTYALIEMYEQTGKQTGYWANYFLRTVRRVGGAQAARRILEADDPASKPSEGSLRLLKANRLDLTLEREILRPKWDPLFTDEERDFCRRRLAEYRYRP